MATYTPNLNLEKPSYNEHQDIDVINENMDKIDAAVSKKAPAGYGLGGNAKQVYSADLNTLTQTGWYRCSWNNPNHPFPDYGCIVEVIASDVMITQTAYVSATNHNHNLTARRTTLSSLTEWGGWKYSNETLPVSQGGTGATSADKARENLGIIRYKNCSNTDFNTIKETGTYYGYTGMTNAKFNAISVLEVVHYSPDWVVQRQTGILDGYCETWQRAFHSGNTWTDWEQIYTSSQMAWKKASVAFSSGSGSVSASGVTTSSTVLATRGDSAMSGGAYATLAADCNSNGTIKMGASNTNSGTYVVNLWWSK